MGKIDRALERLLCCFGIHDWYHHHAQFDKRLCFKVCGKCETVRFYWAPERIQPKERCHA